MKIFKKHKLFIIVLSSLICAFLFFIIYINYFYDRAEKYFREGFELYNSKDFFINFKSKPTIAKFTKAIEINPEMVKAYIWRGNVYYKIGFGDGENFHNCILDYRKALELDPKLEY